LKWLLSSTTFFQANFFYHTKHPEPIDEKRHAWIEEMEAKIAEGLMDKRPRPIVP